MGGERTISGGCETHQHLLSAATPCHHLIFLIFKVSVDALRRLLCCHGYSGVSAEAVSKWADLFVHLQNEKKDKSHRLWGC